MPFTAAQQRAFFEDANQMAIPAITMSELANEGISVVEDLSDFASESIKKIAANLRRPGGMIPCPTIGRRGGAPAGTMVPQPPVVFGSKTQTRLVVAGNLIRFYAKIGRQLTHTSLMWPNVMSKFKLLWKAIQDLKISEDPSTRVQ